MRLSIALVLLTACAAWAQSDPPLFPIQPPPPPPTSCTSARDCREGFLCELTEGPSLRGTCAPGPSDRRFCTTDEYCGPTNHCGQHRFFLQQRKTEWLGICLPGARTDEEGPSPIKTKEGPLRFEYAGIVPTGYVLQERPDLRVMIPGIILFPISYALGQIWFLFLKWNPWSFVPLVGPLTQFFTMRGSVNFATQGEFNLGLISTVGQVLGVTAIIVGVAKPIRWLEKSPVALVPSPGGVAMLGTF